MAEKRASHRLYHQVLGAIVLGILLGYFKPEFAVTLKPLGDGFVKLIKMLIGPVIFCTLISGLTGMKDMKSVGRVGIKALLYFEVVTSLALILGLIMVHWIQPGAGMNIDLTQLDTKALATYTSEARALSVPEFLLNIIPVSLVDALAKNDVLQILLVSLLFGTALTRLGEKGRPLIDFIEQVSRVVFVIVGLIMKLAPLGALGAMAFTVGKYGVGSLSSLARLMGTFYLTCGVFIFAVLGSICRLNGFKITRVLSFIREELFIVLGTSSSESVLPRLILKLENAGCEKSVVGLVVPAGYSFNLDGTSIYLTMAAVFVAQATHTQLSLVQELTLLAILLVSSKGAAGVTGSGFITLAATLSAVPTIPVAGLALILGIDRFMSEARALTNLVGNTVATLVISRWEKKIDLQKARVVT